jgi:hypothetical protein
MVSPANDANPSIQDFKKFREFVRIYYPENWAASNLPELTIQYRNYRILDISEAGLCFLVPQVKTFQDDIIKGKIKFPDDKVIEFSGVVVRREEKHIALRLIIGIPYTYIAAEQVRLRNLEAEGKISFVKK